MHNCGMCGCVCAERVIQEKMRLNQAAIPSFTSAFRCEKHAVYYKHINYNFQVICAVLTEYFTLQKEVSERFFQNVDSDKDLCRVHASLYRKRFK